MAMVSPTRACHTRTVRTLKTLNTIAVQDGLKQEIALSPATNYRYAARAPRALCWGLADNAPQSHP